MSNSRVNRRMIIKGTAAAVAAAATAPATARPAAAEGVARTFANPRATPHPDLNSTGIPALVDLAADLGSHAPGGDSIYLTCAVKANGRKLGIFAHLVTLPNAGGGNLAVSMTDKTTGWYKTYQANIAGDDLHWSKGKLDISMQGLTWTGDTTHMALKIAVPWGSVDARFVSTGPALNYGGTGLINLAGTPTYEFALPAMRTSGTIVIEGRKHAIAGTSWLDRQWGELAQPNIVRWTWMNPVLPNGDAIALWDMVGRGGENSWATVAHPDGSYSLAAVEPLARRASKPWTSPTSGQTYPTCWHVSIPALRARLDMEITGTPGQEIVEGNGGRIEATAAFTGTYNGRKVTGEHYVEMNGSWKA